MGFWLAEKSLMSLFTARSSSARCDLSVGKQSADACRLNFNNRTKPDNNVTLEDFSSLYRQSHELHVPLYNTVVSSLSLWLAAKVHKRSIDPYKVSPFCFLSFG